MELLYLTTITMAMWLLSSAAAASDYGCVPTLNESELHALWEEGVRNRTGASEEHMSIYLLPAYLSVLTARGLHHGRWGCNDYETGSSCSIFPQSEIDSSCKTDDSLTSTDPLEVASTCPWHYQSNTNIFRYPRVLAEAHCNPCGACFHDNATECVTVNYTLPVLLAQAGPYASPSAPCTYAFTTQHVPVACTCALKSKPVYPPETAAEGTYGRKLGYSSMENDGAVVEEDDRFTKKKSSQQSVSGQGNDKPVSQKMEKSQSQDVDEDALLQIDDDDSKISETAAEPSQEGGKKTDIKSKKRTNAETKAERKRARAGKKQKGDNLTTKKNRKQRRKNKTKPTNKVE